MKTKNNFMGLLVKLPFVLAVVFMFTLAGCGDTDGGGGNDPVKYTVTFNANGGTVSPSSIEVESGKTVASLPTPTKTSGDSIFQGWYTKNGTGGDWGSSFTSSTPVTASITVYARWGNTAEPTRYTITFNADGGTVTPSKKQVISGLSAGDLPTPTRPNYTFGGWYTAQNGGGTVFTSASIVTGNITIHAKWTIIENPVERFETRQLTEANWKAILTEIETTGKYVNLNLSACTRSDASTGGGLRSDGTFDPISSFEDGKKYIATIILPNTATSIANSSSYDNPSFKGFSSLNSVSASVVTSIGRYTFLNCTSLTSVNFPMATEIDTAFWGCTSLTSVNFPMATTIGSYTFNSCTNLSSVSFPVTISIGNNAFANCTSLTNAIFPQVTTIGSSTFDGCTSLSSVSFPAATRIGNEAFRDCKSLSSVSFPVTISIGNNAFANCTSLTSVSIPAATTIGQSAFSGCTSLTSVSFPASVDISDYYGDYYNPFPECPNLVSFILTGTGSFSTIESGKALVRNGTELIAYPSASGSIILNNTTVIHAAFNGCTSLTSVSIPAATTIGRGAFSGCTSLANVDLPVAIIIGESAFWGCTSLTSVNLPVVTEINAWAFGNTGTIMTINLGPSAPKLEIYIFESVATASISKTVTVKVPSGATGYGTIPATYSGTDTTENWGNGFRGGGWDDNDGFRSYSINSNITLHVEYQ